MLSRTRFAATGALVLALSLILSSCGLFGGDDEGAETAARELAAALSTGDVTGITFTDPAAADEYADLVKPLKDFTSEVDLTEVSGDGDTRTATLSWATSKASGPLADAVWARETTASLVKDGETWKVAWEPSLVEASLEPGETLAVVRLAATRGNILGRGDQTLVEPRPVVRFGIDKTLVEADAAAGSARRLAAQVDVAADPFAKAVVAAGPKAFVPAVVLRRTEVSAALEARIARIPGARGIDDELPLAPTKDFASALLGTVGTATAEIIEKSEGRLQVGDIAGLSGLQLRYDQTLGGVSGYRVLAKPVDGATPEGADDADDPEPRVLHAVEAVDGKPITLTLDTALQTSAQKLLTRYGPASGLVAIKPSTGEILAAASGPGSKGYNTATFGQYAPGSTFKVVSALALLRSGLEPGAAVECPARTTVNGKSFKNYSDYPAGKLGRITLRDAVAHSCNTAFITERDQITGSALADAAAALGFGVDHDLGFPAYFGQVPAPQGETEAAADLIGQGKILASPLAMAVVAASVAAGETVLPTLLPSVETTPTAPTKPLTATEAEQLRTLLGAVVTDGSGRFLASLAPPAVLAKTGTAEYGTEVPLPTHAWMIGAQGDLAVAVFVADGESGSATAGPVLADFLRAAR